MIYHPYITGSLLGIAVLLCLLCSIGLLVMRDSYQRLQFATPVVSVAILLVTIAVWIEDPSWQPPLKSALITFVLFFTNAVLSHATARAIRIRDAGHWPVSANEKIPIVDIDGTIIADAPSKS